MSKRRILITTVITILFIVTALGIFPGCKNTEGIVEVARIEETENTPIKVVDGEENIVKLAAPATKIIVLAQSALEIIDGLGAMELVVEVDNWSVMMAEPLA